MARRTLDSRPTVRSEGGLLPPELLDRITDPREKDLPGLDPSRDYGLESNARLTEAAARSWEHAKAYWGAFKARLEGSRPGAELGITRQQWLVPLLAELGYDDLGYRQQPEDVNGRSFHVSHRATSEPAAPPLHLVAANQPLDKADPSAPGQKASPHGFLQSYLNEADHLWGIVSNGRQLRILRDNASLTRPAYLEFDLEGMMEGGVFSDFTLLWLVGHRSRLPKGKSDTDACFLEHWYKAALVRGARALGDLRLGVENAIRALGQGFLDHPENEALRAKLAAGELDDIGYYRQLLRVVYRLLFLLVAEERDLLFPRDREDEPQAQKDVRARGRAIYNEHYSVSRLRERLRLDRGDDRHDDLWRAERVAFDLLRAGNANLGLPALGGGIFDTRMCPDLEAGQLRNDAIKAAIRGLSLAPTKSGYRRINYRDLDVEELGSVYESLLDEQPSLRADGTRAQFTLAPGGARKSSGSYYTSSVLVQGLIHSALDPLIKEALASAHDLAGKRTALLAIAVCDPACGSGHFLLAAARRIGQELARLASSEHEPDPGVLRHSIRQAITHCVYGVDLNPLAVDLCRLALWLEGHEPGRPLGFLDHHVKCGNSLVGATAELVDNGIPSAAFGRLKDDTAEAKRLASEAKKRNDTELAKPQLRLFGNPALRPAGPTAADAQEARAIADFDEAGPEDVALKEAEYDEFTAQLGDKKRACDLWTAAFFWPMRAEAPAPPTQSTLLHHRAGQEQDMGPAFERQLEGVLKDVRPFHWELEFPEVFATKGGFDCILGNPPWDTLSPDRREYFGRFQEGMRSLSPSEQDAAIDRLLADPVLARGWERHQRQLFELVRFLKDSGRFTLYAPGNLGKGDFNIYRMFTELALKYARSGGYVALVLPGGIYGGANASAIRQFLMDKCELMHLWGLSNSKRTWFAEVDISRFAAFAARRGGRTKTFPAQFGLTEVSDLADEPIEFDADLLRQNAPDTYAIPDVRTAADLTVVGKMVDAYPAFGDVVAGPPSRHYSRELDMGNDRELFTADPAGVPVYEGRMIGQFDHRAKTYHSGHGNSSVWIERPFGDPAKGIVPQWHVSRTDVPGKLGDRWQRFRLCFRDVAQPRDVRSLIAALVPPGAVCGHTVPTIVFEEDYEWAYLSWLAIANSFVMDAFTRKKLSSPHLTFSVVDSLPFPRPTLHDPWVQRVAPLVLRLVCTAPEMTPFWNAMSKHGWCAATEASSVPQEALVDEESRLRARAELDAIVATEVYGLTTQEMVAILDTFPTAAKYEHKKFGTFRSRELILELMSGAPAK